MAIVTITFSDDENGNIDFDLTHSHPDTPDLTSANIHAFAFLQFKDDIMKRGRMLTSLYLKGVEDGRRLATGIDEDEIDEDDLEIERQEEDFYNGPR